MHADIHLLKPFYESLLYQLSHADGQMSVLVGRSEFVHWSPGSVGQLCGADVDVEGQRFKACHNVDVGAAKSTGYIVLLTKS